ncbi:radical SAM protein [Spirochaeta isovalerica]|uniref:Wyosine [tRNA(Phe)-imidazoG37] synthetase (Radical SAM superfamily) n=1 Tax=Spirochaeta isovalerica TaxID=150 RepID=A0A841R8M9_9SPIO|nr:radical SAM protein [Spirochaeta isovalerica]MBB6479390.1 wyosine [tRNA(Phe)-imidazoG37] synthetase (radical SAM superfamily) [Spirochaeta isovalerica]
MYKYLFGPVPSRRLGVSLGVDLVPHKVCSLDCVYCEVGRTTDLTLERREYFPADEIKSELKSWFSRNPDPQYITFSGSGEPTLNTALPEIIRYIKKLRPAVPVAMLTNGTLLSDKNVREALLECHIVLPSLDGATQPVFEDINRPASGLKIEDCIEGLIHFRKEYSGEIRLEVFILPGYNDGEWELTALKKAILKIQPDSVQLNSLDRPGVLPGLRKASTEELEKVISFWKLDNVEIISKPADRKNVPSYKSEAGKTILDTISRRPCTSDDLREILGIHVNELNKYLDVLESDGQIESVREERGLFYKLKKR